MKTTIRKRIIATALLFILIIQVAIPAIYAQTDGESKMIEAPRQETKTITNFAELSEDVKNITVALATLVEEIYLPEILTGTVEYTVYEETDPNTELIGNKVVENVELTVIWTSNKKFSTEAEDEFVFTAKLENENYTVLADLEMPKITVRVIASSVQPLLDIATRSGEAELIDISENGLLLSGANGSMPTEPTEYKAGEGSVKVTPASGENSKVIVELNNATVDSRENSAIYLPDGEVELVVIGENKLLSNFYTVGEDKGSIYGKDTKLSIKGEGTLITSDETINSGSLGYGIYLEGDSEFNYENGERLSLIAYTEYTVNGQEKQKQEVFGEIKLMGEFARDADLEIHPNSQLTLKVLGQNFNKPSFEFTKEISVSENAKLIIDESIRLVIKETGELHLTVNNLGSIIVSGELVLEDNRYLDNINNMNIATKGEGRLLVGGYLIDTNSGGKIFNNIDGEQLHAGNGGEYTCGPGTMKWEPLVEDGNLIGGKIILHNADIRIKKYSGSDAPAISIADGIDIPITLEVIGNNTIENLNGKDIAIDNLTITGNGILTAKGRMPIEYKTRFNMEEFNGELNAFVVQIVEGANPQITSYGITSYTEKYGNTNYTSLTVESGSVLTMEPGSFIDTNTIVNKGEFTNNGTINLKSETTGVEIEALNLKGSGVVKVDNKTYNNHGLELKIISGDLDLSSIVGSNTNLENDGYTWKDNILTLKNAYFDGNLTIPTNVEVKINTLENGTINGSILRGSNFRIDLIFTGIAPLNITDGISGGTNFDKIRVESGTLSVGGSIFLGASGAQDGKLIVSGKGTTLNVSSSDYGVNSDMVEVKDGAYLNITASDLGIKAISSVDVTNGSVLTTSCDYGVYIEDGKLNVDDTSKLITNGTVAAFCVIDKTGGKSHSDVVTLPGLPDGTAVTSVNGTSYGYWSHVYIGDSLILSKENTEPVSLANAAKGRFVFKKIVVVDPPAGSENLPVDPPSGGDGDDGSTKGVRYTLTFEANGGNSIPSLTKAYGTVIDLSDYDSNREAYTFDGWYADMNFTKKVTTVTLRKNTIVYAKWKEGSKKNINPFNDVFDSDYYYDPVLWALENNITNGTTGTTFSPNMSSTRAQMVTLIWRAVGTPEPITASSQFTDLHEDAYYYKAILWAAENGFAIGTSLTEFSPDLTVTRCQAVAFLWRIDGKIAATTENPYGDVFELDYYHDAVLWAVEKEITQGATPTTFSPADYCTRAQIVTFLYRYMNKDRIPMF